MKLDIGNIKSKVVCKVFAHRIANERWSYDGIYRKSFKAITHRIAQKFSDHDNWFVLMQSHFQLLFSFSKRTTLCPHSDDDARLLTRFARMCRFRWGWVDLLAMTELLWRLNWCNWWAASRDGEHLFSCQFLHLTMNLSLNWCLWTNSMWPLMRCSLLALLSLSPTAPSPVVNHRFVAPSDASTYCWISVATLCHRIELLMLALPGWFPTLVSAVVNKAHSMVATRDTWCQNFVANTLDTVGNESHCGFLPFWWFHPNTGSLAAAWYPCDRDRCNCRRTDSMQILAWHRVRWHWIRSQLGIGRELTQNSVAL